MDALSRTYEGLLTGTYDCLDRIVVNAYFRMGHDAGGFRVWWRKLTGSEDTLDNAHLSAWQAVSGAVYARGLLKTKSRSANAGQENQNTRSVRSF